MSFILCCDCTSPDGWPGLCLTHCRSPLYHILYAADRVPRGKVCDGVQLDDQLPGAAARQDLGGAGGRGGRIQCDTSTRLW